MLSTDDLTQYQKQKVNQIRKRKAVKLFEEKRAKRTQITSQGRRTLLDSDDEDVIAKCIEDKATYHGRRKNLVMYTNRRVKKCNLLRLTSVNEKAIKSATTVFNWSKPRNARSIQARLHKGKGLFLHKEASKGKGLRQ